MPKIQNRFDFRQEADTLEIYIYGVIESDYRDWWTGEEIESETSADFFREKLAEYPNAKTITLFVNSQGGSVIEAMGIRAQLARHPAKKIAVIDGWAASAASFIVTICDEVRMFSCAMQMLHNMWVFAAGNAKELRQMADTLDKMMEGNRQAYLEKAGDKITEERLIELMEAESWLTAKDCIEIGLADEIISEQPKQIAQLHQLIHQALPVQATPPIETEPKEDIAPTEEVQEPVGINLGEFVRQYKIIKKENNHAV